MSKQGNLPPVTPLQAPLQSANSAPYFAPSLSKRKSLEVVTLCSNGATGCRPTFGGPGSIGTP
jgi:hypothetical protein